MLDNNNKVNYVEYETAITAKNMNDIQESILKNQEEINIFKAVISDVSSFGAKGDGVTDDTQAIQTALNLCGTVIISKPGIYITKKLIMGDNTTLKLYKGVTLKRKDNTNDYLIVNKGHIDGIRNKNITIDGGKFDMNHQNNNQATGDLSQDTQSFVGMGILINKVENLTICNVDEIGNEGKYCYLIVDCENVNCYNIRFNNGSDGLHFQPPLKNVNINNLSGFTHDDMVSFTAGDFTRYALGKTGNFENIQISNINSDNAKALIKMVGCGEGESEFKNFNIKNLTGSVSTSAVGIPNSDTIDGNIYLSRTKVSNIVIENVNVKTSLNNQNLFRLGATGDITIRNVELPSQDNKYTFIHAFGDNNSMNTLVLDNIKFKSDKQCLLHFLNLNNTLTIDKLIIKNSNIENEHCPGSIFINGEGGLNQVLIESSIAKTSGATIVTKNGESQIDIKNSIFKNNTLLTPYVDSNLTLSNVKNESSLSNNIYFGKDVNVSVVAINTDIKIGSNLTSSRKLRLDGKGIEFVNSNVSLLTPKIGDTILNKFQNTPFVGDVIVWNGTAWESLTFKEILYSSSEKIVPARTGSEIIVHIENQFAIDREVYVCPKFHIPYGLAFNGINRDTGRVRIRLDNVTNEDITIPAGSWIIKLK